VTGLSSQTIGDLGAIAEHLTEDHAAWELPGMAAVLVVDGAGVWSGGFGRANEAGAPATADTCWRVAAVGQPVLAAAMGHLAEAGVLALDDPLDRWLPEAAALGTPAGDSTSDRPLTLADCAAHTTGLPPMPPMAAADLSALRFPSWPQLAADLSAVRSSDPGPAGPRFSYSNLAWALLAQALTRAAGRPIEDYATEHILRPLGMARTGWAPLNESAGPRRADEDAQPAVHATGYGAFGDPPIPAPTPQLGAFRAPWGLWTTASDMARFLAWQLSSDGRQVGDGDGPRTAAAPLTVDMLRTLQTPEVIEADKHSGATPGWLIGLTAAGPTLFHGGADPGFAAYAALSPRLGLAAFVAANRASNPEALGEMAHGMLGFARETLGR